MIQADLLRPVRRQFAESLGLTQGKLIEAFARVRREDFLGKGPWMVGCTRGYLRSPTADPRHVICNVSVALKPERGLNNGMPGVVGGLIQLLELREGDRVLHLGAGTGYYSAIMGYVTGDVDAVELEPDFAPLAKEALRDSPGVNYYTADAMAFPLQGIYDAILVNAGVGEIPLAWMNSLNPMEGRMVSVVHREGGTRGRVEKMVRSGGEFQVEKMWTMEIYSMAGG